MGAMPTALYESGIGELPYMERIGWGVVSQRTFNWPSSLSTRYKAVATGMFTAIEGREYTIDVFPGRPLFENTSIRNMYVELCVASNPFTVDVEFSTAQMVYQKFDSGTAADRTMIPLRVMLRSVASISDAYYEFLPGSTYWMLRMRTGTGSPDVPITVNDTNLGNRMVVVSDIGPARTTPSATSGATTGTGTTFSARRTDTFNATWSATWAGSTKIAGTTQHANFKSVYTGTDSSGIRSSAIGFPALGLSGRAILKAEVWLQNGYAKNTDIECFVGTASSTTEPSSIPTRSNTGVTTFRRGEGRWVTLPSSAHTGLANGTIRAITVGYVDDTYCYGYFSGFGQTSAPKLRITSED
jgi:hypothetical protein